MTLRSLALVLALPLAACGTDARYLIAQGPAETGQPDARSRVRVRTIEVRDVSLPAYASATDIVVEQKNGALMPIGNAVWADDPVRGVTGALARALDARATATVAAEPWPLLDPADVQLEVRVDRMIARADGQFEMTGQYAIAAPSGAIREQVRRFAIRTPLQGTTPGAVAQATGLAIDRLAAEVVARLRGGAGA